MTDNAIPQDVLAAAHASHRRWDIPSSVILAQWALESSWGRAMPSGSNNPFGIKAIRGQPFVLAGTREVLNGRERWLRQRFRRFESIADAFDEHGRLLATGTAYAAARAVRHDRRAFVEALQGHYATDPAYAAKLLGIIDRNGLARFDDPAPGGTA